MEKLKRKPLSSLVSVKAIHHRHQQQHYQNIYNAVCKIYTMLFVNFQVETKNKSTEEI